MQYFRHFFPCGMDDAGKILGLPAITAKKNHQIISGIVQRMKFTLVHSTLGKLAQILQCQPKQRNTHIQCIHKKRRRDSDQTAIRSGTHRGSIVRLMVELLHQAKYLGPVGCILHTAGSLTIVADHLTGTAQQHPYGICRKSQLYKWPAFSNGHHIAAVRCQT